MAGTRACRQPCRSGGSGRSGGSDRDHRDGGSVRLQPDPEPCMKKKLNIGLVGYGFMGRTHSNAFLQAPRFFDVPYEPVLKAVCARNADRVKAFASNWGYESIETDWRALVDRKDIDLVDIASPNDTHAEIAVAAARADKMVMCEKPLGRNAAEAEKMVAAVESARVANSVWYNYRRVPAVTLLKHFIDEGRLGRVFHYRAQFIQDWTISRDLPQGGEGLWRLDLSVRQWRHRRSPRALHRHGTLAERPGERRHRDDRDLHQGAHAHAHRARRTGRHRRCERVSRAVSQRIAGDLRGDALRPRSQGALHARDQR